MKILVIGGSRFLGKAFVEEAQSKGHEITVFNRGNHNHLLKDVEVLVGDRNGDLENLKGHKWDAVLDTSGLIPRSVRNLTGILKEQTDFYAFVSSISVYEDWIEKGITEDYPVQTMSVQAADELTKDPASLMMQYYGQFKTLCELEAERNMPGKVLKIRAGQLVGANDYTDRLPYWVNRIASGGVILAPGDPESSFVQLIDVKDLAAWILRMMERKHTGTYNATGHSVLLRDVLDECRKVIGSEVEFIWAHESFLLEHDVSPWVQMPLWLPVNTPLGPEHTEPWRGAFHMNIEKALNDGLVFRPLRETIEEVHNWLNEQPIPSESWKAGITREREQFLLEALARKQ